MKGRQQGKHHHQTQNDLNLPPTEPNMEPLQVHDLPIVFQDVTPIPQPDASIVVCRIDYQPDFESAYNYFRAVVATEEISFRAMRLTELCLQLNPANYTVWQVRRHIMRELRKQSGVEPDNEEWSVGIEYDQQLCSKLGGANPKNYQIWYHRRALLSSLLENNKDGNGNEISQQGTAVQRYFVPELEYLESVISQDGKNYHAWSHRQWVVSTLASHLLHDQHQVNELFQRELEYTTQLIQRDVRNNSAWNHRWFVIHRGQDSQSASYGISPAVTQQEAAYALEIAKNDMYNESPWRYWCAILKEWIKSIPNVDDKNRILLDYEQRALNVQQSSSEDPVSNHLLGAIVDLAEWRGDASRVVELTSQLVNVDPIRQKYWQWRGQHTKLQPSSTDWVNSERNSA